MLARFAAISKKSHEATDSMIRNQHVTITNIETQLGEFTKLINVRLPLKNLEPKSQSHVIVIYTKKEVDFEPLVTHDTDTRQPDPQSTEMKHGANSEKSMPVPTKLRPRNHTVANKEWKFFFSSTLPTTFSLSISTHAKPTRARPEEIHGTSVVPLVQRSILKIHV